MLIYSIVMAGNCLSPLILAALVGISVNAVAVPVPNIAIPRERSGFIFLGTTRKDNQVTVNGISSITTKDFNYWLSVNAEEYEGAQQDCRANADELLQIETVEERDEVDAFLQDTDQTVTRVWVGGKYQVGSKSFTWENGLPITNELWGTGQPSERNSNTRVAADIVGQYISLRTQSSTVMNRYICEGL